ncbi:MAG: hypothetical protein OXE04_02845 [bacterium]|nr:hypothetical protein [bacterium]MCY4257212.1 hypothetical protein [bacterium]
MKSQTSSTTIEELEEHDVAVADLIAAHDLAEQNYFPAALAAAPPYRHPVASDSTQGFQKLTRE